MRQKKFLTMIAFGLLSLLCLTQCKKEAPASIMLSEPVVTLSSTVNSAKVKVTSNVDWICSGESQGLGIPTMTLDWVVIEPFVSKAGTTEMSIRLIEDKHPAKEAQLNIELQALDGRSTQSTLTIKYKP